MFIVSVGWGQHHVYVSSCKKIVSNFAMLTVQEVTFFVSFFEIVAAFSFSPLISSGKRWQICFIYSDICIYKKIKVKN